MLVTSVRPINRRKCRVVLDEEVTFILGTGDLQRFSIREGASLDETVYEEILEQKLKPMARERVLRALQVSDKTERELRCLLEREGYPCQAAEDAIAMVQRCRYVNDEAYARRYAEQEGRKKSRRQLEVQMERKGFSRELIRRVLEECPPDEGMQIRALLEKKGFRPGMEEKSAEWAPIRAMLLRRGYSCRQIEEAVKIQENGE